MRRPWRIGSAVWAIVAAASPAGAQTLSEALAAAYANNPSLLAERAKVRGTDERVSQALAGWRPSIEMNADHGSAAIYTNTVTNRSQHRDPSNLEFSITQSLFRGGRTVAAVNEAENAVRAARARLDSVEQTVLRDGATAYVNVVRDQAVVDLNISNEQVLLRQLEATRDRFQVGEITRTDVYQAEARLARAKADRIKAESDLEASRANYRNLIGEMPGRLRQPEVPLELPTDILEAVRIASSESPKVIAGEYDERALTDAADGVRGELLPVIDLKASATRALETQSQESRLDNYQAKFVLSVPLYQSGAAYSRLRAAKQSIAEQRERTGQARQDAVESATKSWEATQAARARGEALRSQIEAAEVALEGVEREAAVGSRTVLDVLDAEQELLDAKVNLVRAEHDYMVAIFDLRVALGQMTARRLQLPVDYYDPERHYREIRDQWIGTSSSGDADRREMGGDGRQ